MECGVSECGCGVCVCVELVSVGVGVECVWSECGRGRAWSVCVCVE